MGNLKSDRLRYLKTRYRTARLLIQTANELLRFTHNFSEAELSAIKRNKEASERTVLEVTLTVNQLDFQAQERFWNDYGSLTA